MSSAARLGLWSARGVMAIGIAYAGALAAGFSHVGLSAPIGDPVLAVMECLTILSALALLGWAAAQHLCTAPPRTSWSLLALCLMAMFAAATIGVHVTLLTVGRQTAMRGLVWPSVPYAIELSAWDLLLGLALLAGGAALDATREGAWLRRGLLITGAFCLAGLAGPMIGDMRWQRIGIAGYALLLPVVAVGMARWFRRAGEATGASAR